ncbi:unnamed protein product, partial [Heterosigma akashiwo]
VDPDSEEFFELENQVEGLQGTLKLSQNPRKILKGVIRRVLNPSYGKTTGKGGRHLLQ